MRYFFMLTLLQTHGFLLIKCFVSVNCSVVPDSLQSHGLWPARFLCPWDSPGKNTGVGSYFLFQGILLTQGSNLGLLYCRLIFYCLGHQGNPGKLKSINKTKPERRA